MKSTKIIELFIEEDQSIDFISLVKYPAIELDFMKFSKDSNISFAKIDVEKRIACGPAMIPDKMIIRYNQETNEEYYVYFSKDTIEKVAEQFLIQNKNYAVNLEHNTVVNDISLVESWIVVDNNNDKSKALGYDVPIGTWMCSFKINDDTIWNDIKEGDYRGFSVEGYFVEKFSAINDEIEEPDEDTKLLNEIKDFLATL